MVSTSHLPYIFRSTLGEIKGYSTSTIRRLAQLVKSQSESMSRLLRKLYVDVMAFT